MGGILRPDSPVIRFLWKAADLIALNLLWLACCLPIVTIGPSTAALYCVARKIADGEWPGILKSFFREFVDNFKVTMIVSLALLIPVFLGVFYFLLSISGLLDNMVLIKCLCYPAIIVIMCVCTYTYPLIAFFDNSAGNTLKNAFILPLANPLLALLMTGINLLPALLILISLKLFIRLSLFWILIGVALSAMVNTKLMKRLLQRVAPEAFTERDAIE